MYLNFKSKALAPTQFSSKRQQKRQALVCTAYVHFFLVSRQRPSAGTCDFYSVLGISVKAKRESEGYMKICNA